MIKSHTNLSSSASRYFCSRTAWSSVINDLMAAASAWLPAKKASLRQSHSLSTKCDEKRPVRRSMELVSMMCGP